MAVRELTPDPRNSLTLLPPSTAEIRHLKRQRDAEAEDVEHSDLHRLVYEAEQQEYEAKNLPKYALIVRDRHPLVKVLHTPADIWREQVQIPMAIHRARAMFKQQRNKPLNPLERVTVTIDKVAPLVGRIVFGNHQTI